MQKCTGLLQKLQEGHITKGEVAPFPPAQVEARGTSAVEEYVFGRRRLMMMMMTRYYCRDKALGASRQGHITKVMMTPATR